ncbi:DNA-binding transcriptional regulator DsdC [Ferrimonas balearica]|uniref:DNA-binding transcriptional regulator DsdC n=1 Tax=Ferrimonas balearica TaxID=44012 RepID=UPI001F29BBFB|nr:DNA-binding transcriptional regulator DsdC [Ferrimonas balearica]MBY6016878.1 DNA-binding transcriptional regulator DsdC [Halomonas denitrificans]MBY6093150.1 DNA-binding transcriptional regulator DsdC [Ferrimonas balearica]
MLSSAILSSMHCFASAARHMSFTKAAEELHLTQSAVSHRIKKLEEQLGFKLFLRFNRRLQLTEQGQGLMAVLDQSLGGLESAIRDIRQQEFTSTLSMAVPHSFARCWLSERLGDLHRRYPKMTLQVRAQSRSTDFQHEPVDVAVYYDRPDRSGLHQHVLFGEMLVPVCSKDYADEHNLWQNPDGLAECLLLHDETAWQGTGFYTEWQYWAERAGIDPLAVTRGFVFNRADLAYRAAMSGQGVALGRWRMVAPSVRSGALVVPIDAFVEAEQCYLAVCHPDRQEVPAIKAVLEWLDEMAHHHLEKLAQEREALAFEPA